MNAPKKWFNYITQWVKFKYLSESNNITESNSTVIMSDWTAYAKLIESNVHYCKVEVQPCTMPSLHAIDNEIYNSTNIVCFTFDNESDAELFEHLKVGQYNYDAVIDKDGNEITPSYTFVDVCLRERIGNKVYQLNIPFDYRLSESIVSKIKTRSYENATSVTLPHCVIEYQSLKLPNAIYPNASRNEMLRIFNKLGTITTTQTLSLGSTLLAKLTDEDKKIATDKGWTLA